MSLWEHPRIAPGRGIIAALGRSTALIGRVAGVVGRRIAIGVQLRAISANGVDDGLGQRGGRLGARCGHDLGSITIAVHILWEGWRSRCEGGLRYNAPHMQLATATGSLNQQLHQDTTIPSFCMLAAAEQVTRRAAMPPEAWHAPTWRECEAVSFLVRLA